ncbi:MAG TPA: divalent-cation tolerance protein CutA [Acidimicrobiales bacterium]|nr:divalent-cation tolerance protein CutA [Acidimicrobiales bacterium]
MDGDARGYQVVTAVADQAAASDLARGLVEARLAACVQVVGPVTSTYRWLGRVETATEWLCVAKTTGEALEAAMAAIAAAHAYDEPEITATPIVAGSDGYLGWLRAEVRNPPPPE